MKYSSSDLMFMATHFLASNDSMKKSLLVARLMDVTGLSKSQCEDRIEMLAMGFS